MFLDTLDTKDCSIYRLNKSLLNKQPASQPLSGLNDKAFVAKEKAELHADFLEKQFSLNAGPNLTEVAQFINALKSTTINQSNLFTTPGSIQHMIKNLPNKKIPGIYLITNTALKCLPPNLILTLTKIISGCLRISYFPSVWKAIIIITIPKPGKDPALLESYCPLIFHLKNL